MAKEEDFVVVTDLQSVERMLTNAEIDHEKTSLNDPRAIVVTITTEQGFVFNFDDDGQLLGMDVERA